MKPFGARPRPGANRMIQKPMKPIKQNYLSYDVTVRTSSDGEIALTEIWEQDGQVSRANGPAVIERSDLTGQVILEAWCMNGTEHRKCGPAITEYHDSEDGTIALQAWKWEGKHHRRGGPAVQEWSDTGNLLREEWWLNGRKLGDRRT